MHIFLAVVSILVTLLGIMAQMPPEEATSNLVGWLNKFGIEKLPNAFAGPNVDNIVTALCFLILVPVIIVWRRSLSPTHKQIVEPSKPDQSSAQASQMDRQPINHAYEYLLEMGAWKEGDESPQIAHYLRQAALDGGITIWGAEPSSLLFEWEIPLLLEIRPEFWQHYETDPFNLMRSPSNLLDGGCTTFLNRSNWYKVKTKKFYRHSHVDMNQIRVRWKRTYEAKESSESEAVHVA